MCNAANIYQRQRCLCMEQRIYRSSACPKNAWRIRRIL
nr:MAG TPA: hypothetical protein [Bacteriophage sp.]